MQTLCLKCLKNLSKTSPKSIQKPLQNLSKNLSKIDPKIIEKPIQKPIIFRPPPKSQKTNKNIMFFIDFWAIRQPRITENNCVFPSPNPYPIRRLSHVHKTSIALYALPVIRRPRIIKSLCVFPSPNPYP